MTFFGHASKLVCKYFEIVSLIMENWPRVGIFTLSKKFLLSLLSESFSESKENTFQSCAVRTYEVFETLDFCRNVFSKHSDCNLQ